MVSISVVIPVYNSAGHLRECLEHLDRSGLKPLECIVVDDGSTDESVEVARGFGARVVSTFWRSGPSHARNLGASMARGEVLFFVDADVCVYPHTLHRIATAFEDDPALGAMMGSYDDSPASPDFLSQYKNLMHSFVHQNSRREACTFWSGCGAIRRELFLRHSGFSMHYRRPAIEDIELGYRLRQAGCKMVLDKDLLVKHLKRWTFWNLVKTDMLDRGIPWTELILRDGHMPNDLNLQLSQRVSVALVFLLLCVAMAAAHLLGGYFLTPLLALLFFLVLRYWVEPSGEPVSRGAVAAFLVTLSAATGLAAWHHMFALIPLLLAGALPLIFRHRYACRTGRGRRLTGIVEGAYAIASLALCLSYFPRHPLVFCFFALLCTIVVLNNHFYLFLAAKQGRLSAFAALPFHLLYHFYNGLSFVVGAARFYTGPGLRVKPQLPPQENVNRA